MNSIIPSKHKNNDFSNNKPDKKFKLNLENLNQSNENKETNKSMASFSEEKIYTKELYDKINSENEKVIEFLKSVCSNDKNINLQDVVENELLQDVVDSLYEKATKLFRLEWENSEKNHYYKLFELSSNERKLLLTAYHLLSGLVINKEIGFNTIGKDSENLHKLIYCIWYSPYIKYFVKILKSTQHINCYDDYKNLFNYEHLINLNIGIYSHLYRYNEEKNYFYSQDIFRFHLSEIVEIFRLLQLNEQNEELFNMFIELDKKIPDLMIDTDYEYLNEF